MTDTTRNIDVASHLKSVDQTTLTADQNQALRRLFDRLPDAGEEWNLDDRRKWLRLVRETIMERL